MRANLELQQLAWDVFSFKSQLFCFRLLDDDDDDSTTFVAICLFCSPQTKTEPTKTWTRQEKNKTEEAYRSGESLRRPI